MADALERITNLIALLLETRSPLTTEQIMNQLAGQYPANEVAQRGAFERDKKLLRDVGVPLESEVLGGDQAGRTAYRISRSRYELADMQLADDERQALQLAVAAVRSTDAQFGLLKLGGSADTAAVVSAHIPAMEALPLLREAAANRCVAEFDYRGASRQLEPYSLLLREGFWYVIGNDLQHLAVRTYRVDRISSDVAVGEPGSFERPANFDPRATFAADPKEVGDTPGARARVLVDATRAAYVAGEVGPDRVLARRSDGAIEVEVACANAEAFRSWLFALGTHAEVLEPASVRADVVDWLRAVAGVG